MHEQGGMAVCVAIHFLKLNTLSLFLAYTLSLSLYPFLGYYTSLPPSRPPPPFPTRALPLSRPSPSPPLLSSSLSLSLSLSSSLAPSPSPSPPSPFSSLFLVPLPLPLPSPPPSPSLSLSLSPSLPLPLPLCPSPLLSLSPASSLFLSLPLSFSLPLPLPPSPSLSLSLLSSMASKSKVPPSPTQKSACCSRYVSSTWLLLALALLTWREVDRALDPPRGTSEIPEASESKRRSTAPETWVRDESWKDIFAGIRGRPKFNLSHPMVAEYAAALTDMMSAFGKIEGIEEGMGSGGMVNQAMLRAMASKPQFMSCAGHVRIVDGTVYFRYGGFVATWYRLRRFNQSIKMLQDAVNWYGLHDLKVEFFFNTCDLPMSFDNILSRSNRAGYCVFSTQAATGTTDIIVPDPLDLAPDYMPDTKNQVPWDQKKDLAIFRGASTNYDLREYTWRASPRLRLHRMSELMPDLVDAKVMKWSHISEDELDLIDADGLKLGKRINHKQKNYFKYEIAVDGGVGTCRTCGLLASNMLMVRQASGFQQFFEPLLKEGAHYLRSAHHFQDLPHTIDWARRNDKKVKKMIENANDIANWACTWEGRTLYWAIALAKYAEIVLDKSVVVEKPSSLCGGEDQEAVLDVYRGYKKVPKCGDADEDNYQPKCVHWCTFYPNPEEKWKWLSSDVLKKMQRLGPRQRKH